MTLTSETFLGALGFEENPFTITNADEEPELPSYFVPPPYFASVLGSPTKPKSAVVFAPRGGGKTAQKVMIENAALSPGPDSFLCITYDEFELPASFTLEQATADWHLTNVVRKLIMALLIATEDATVSMALSQKDKNSLAKAAVTFLSKMTEAEFRNNIESLRNWRGKVDYYWEKYGGKVANLLTAIAARFDIGSLEKLADPAIQNRSSVTEYLRQLVTISKSLEYKSVYVLVDRIDETRITSSNAKDSFDFIKDLLKDLHVLEMDGLAFKFFIWDQTRPFYYADGARPDRVPLHDLDWTADQISQMLSKRLMSFSNGKVASLQQLFRREVVLDMHTLVCYLSAGSPRDMIRLAGRMVDEQTKTADMPGLIAFPTAELAIRKFASERSKELYPQFAAEVPRIGLARFKISSLPTASARNGRDAMEKKVQKWQDSGMIARSEDAQDLDPSDRVYSLTDPRLVIAAKSNHDRLAAILRNCFLVCPFCGELNATDSGFNYCDCSNCGADIDSDKDLLRILNFST